MGLFPDMTPLAHRKWGNEGNYRTNNSKRKDGARVRNEASIYARPYLAWENYPDAWGVRTLSEVLYLICPMLVVGAQGSEAGGVVGGGVEGWGAHTEINKVQMDLKLCLKCSSVNPWPPQAAVKRSILQD